MLTDFKLMFPDPRPQRSPSRTLFFAIAVLLAWSLHPAAQLRPQPVGELPGQTSLSLLLRKLGSIGTFMQTDAHPDDEDNGLLAMLGQGQGMRTVLVTATRGEGGTDDPEAYPPELLARIRSRELAESLRVVGIAEHRWLRTPHPLVDGRLADVPVEDGVGAVARLLIDVRPDLVVTFGPDGLTGHADHRTISGWVTRAWERTGAHGDLWYAALPPDFLDRWGELCAEHGVWMDGGPPEPVEPRNLVHVHTCAGPLMDRKYAALLAQRSQVEGLLHALTPERYRTFLAEECFRPGPAPRPMEAM